MTMMLTSEKKLDYSLSHVLISTSIQELNTLHYICELKRTQLLTILAMFVQNLQIAGYFPLETIVTFAIKKHYCLVLRFSSISITSL